MKASQITAGITVKIGANEPFKVHSVATCGFTGKVLICRSNAPCDYFASKSDREIEVIDSDAAEADLAALLEYWVPKLRAVWDDMTAQGGTDYEGECRAIAEDSGLDYETLYTAASSFDY